MYTKKPLLILDNIFAGLDPKTEHDIFMALFGPEGLLQANATIGLAINSSG
jgi:ABC-type multidrug transport system fused ATPase/permease subunit